MIAGFVESKLSPADLAPIDAHLDACPECWMVVAALAGTLSETKSEKKPVPAPKLGRYELLDVVGQGAMGIVYVAHDPKLERKVAIKLLHAQVENKGSGRGPSRQERFLREAKAMARLVHPNVVTVHDTGTADDQVFVAMEYVDGMNLRQWLSAGTRSVTAIIDAFTQAGKGLAAAHEAGIVHRDFKPDNVFVGKDEVVKVGDFGLVSFSEQRNTEDGDAEQESVLSTSASATTGTSGDQLATLTQTGTRLGTALYMSPEQFDVGTVGPASDQFSFCVALYQALYGVCPFAGKSGREIRLAIEAQTFTAPTKNTQVPARIHRIVVRGLRKDPAERHGSMKELLQALSRDSGRSRVRWVAAAAAIFLVGGGAMAMLLGSQDPAKALCSAPTQAMAGVWDDIKAASLRVEFAKSPNPRAPETAGRVAGSFDAYAQGWLSMRVETCEATRIEGHQSEQLLDLRVDCLNRKLAGFDAALDTFVQEAPKAEFADLAVSAALNMPDLADCADTSALLGAVARPKEPAKAEKLAELEGALDRAVALEQVGNFIDALKLAKTVADDAKLLQYPPLYHSALYEVALLQYELAEYEASKETAALLVQAASASADDKRVTDAWLLQENLAVKQSDYEEALRLKPWTEAAILRSGDKPRQRAKLMAAIATVHLRQGRYPEAERIYLETLALLETEEAPSPHSVVALHLNLGITSMMQRKTELADEHLSQALQLQEETLGPQHPDLARVLLSICSSHHASARFDEAEASCMRSLHIREQALGESHPDLAHPLTVLADLARMKRDLPKARALYQRALTIREDALGPTHPDLANVLTNFGDLLSELGENEVAAKYIGRALAIHRKNLGDKHQLIGISLHNLGNLAFGTKDYVSALDYQQQALAMFEETLGPDHPYLSYALTAIGEIQIASKHAGLAVSPLRRALSIRRGEGNAPIGRAQTQFLLAKALFLTASQAIDKQKALELARGAEQDFQEIGDSAIEDLEAVQSWLKARG